MQRANLGVLGRYVEPEPSADEKRVLLLFLRESLTDSD
jgi:hypothetical protein